MSDFVIWAAIVAVVLLVLGIVVWLALGGEQLLRSDERDETRFPKPANDDRKTIPEEKVW